MRSRAVFPQVNSLPGAEREPAGVQRQGKVHGGQRGADVRGHVVSALGGMAEQRVAVRHEPRKKCVEVEPHIRIGVFLNQQRGGGVAQMQRQQTVAEFVFRNPLFHRVGELHQPASPRGDDEFVEGLAHGLRRHWRALVGEHLFKVGVVRLAGVERLLIMPAGKFGERRRLV
jgi:hypothetical protein